jgi:hypothetical protein
MLMTKKEFYTSPEVDVLEVKIEGVVCQSLTGGTAGAPGDPGAPFVPDDIFNGGVF